MLPTLMLLALMIVTAALTSAQQPSSILTEDTAKISDHVWVIIGNPNIAIIVGNRATLVVDTGLGARNGAMIARVVAKLSTNSKLFLTTTHFHPEHAAGEPGFPPNTILIRDAVQQQEMELHGQEMIDSFSSRSAQNKDLLAGPKLRPPDVIFDSEAKLDLGGVTARLLFFGGAHTKGDELIFVEPDRTLVSGDVVQNKVVPAIFGDGGTPSSWLAVVEKLLALNASHVVPDHSAPGDGGLVTAERNFISDLRTRALALKKQGVSQEDAGKQLTAEFKTKYPDWPNMNVTGFVQRIYAEN
jgi:glyoxylase-like metal-dependent hydrolase (beta-lactamase superfamily II)